MKKVLKSSLSFILAIAIIFGSAYAGLAEIDFMKLFAVRANAASESDFKFTLNSDKASYYVSASNTSIEGELIIPDSYNSKPVTAVGSFANCKNLISVIIPDSVSEIFGYAFDGCTSLTSITLPDNLTALGRDAFINTGYYNDSSNWDNDVLYIDNYLVKAKQSLKGNYLVKDGTKIIGSYSFQPCPNLTGIVIPNTVTAIGASAFAGSKALTSIEIPASVKTISPYAFSDCVSIKDVYITDLDVWCGIAFGNTGNNPLWTGANLYLDDELVAELAIPDTVTSIGDYAFTNCTSITSVTIHDDVQIIGVRAFAGCSNLKDVDFGKGVISTGQTAFGGCTALESIEIPENIKIIDGGTFSGCTSLKSVDMGNCVTSIGNSAFNGCSSLALINIPDSVTSLGDSVFYDCTNLATVNIGNGITSIGYSTFKNCKSLTSIIIPDGVTSIGDSAFMNCISLSSVEIGNAVQSIGNYAFMNCTSLSSVVLGDSVSTIKMEAFYGCTSLVTLVIPEKVKTIQSKAFVNCYKLEKIYWNAKSVSDLVGDSALFDKAGTQGTGIDVVFGDTVEKIPAYLFYTSDITKGVNITKVTIIGNNASIGAFAFRGCGTLGEITISDSVKRVGNSAFYNTGYYNEASNWVDGVLYIGNHLIDVDESLYGECTIRESTKSIADSAFYNCRNITKIYWNAQSVTDFTSSSVVFDNAGIAGSGIEVIFGNAVEYIPAYLFYVVDSSHRPKVTSITIGENVTSIGTCAFWGCAGVKSITIPENVTNIGGSAFSNCGNLEKLYWNARSVDDMLYNSSVFYDSGGLGAGIDVVFGDSVEKIPANLFQSNNVYRPKIVSVTFGENITTIGSGAFEGCVNISTFVFPESITNIESGAFKGCVGIETITIPSSITEIDYSVFEGCYNLESIAIPVSVRRVDTAAFRSCNGLKYVFYAGSENDWQSIRIFSDNEPLKNAIIHYNATDHTCESEWTVDVEPTCTETGLKSRHCIVCDYKTDIVVIDALGHDYVPQDEHSGSHANGHETVGVCSRCGDENTVFTADPNCIECNFEVTLLNGTEYKLIKYIGDGAEVVIPSVHEGLAVTTIGNSCFKGATEVTSIEIGEGVTKIGSLAFMGCSSLDRVVIPESVTSIGLKAFYGFTGTIYCYSGSYAHEYAISNNIKYAIITDEEPGEPIRGTEDTQIDYDNFIIRTNVENCNDIIDILGLSDSAIAIPTASYVCGDVEMFGTGTIITVFDGNEYIGDFTLIVNGDTNGDSVCDAIDAWQVSLASNGQGSLSGVYSMAADNNGDGVIDINDYQAIINRVAA